MADETPSSEMMDEQLEAEVSGARAHVRQRLPAYIATLIGGTVAMFVNAPLTSPDDLVGNTASVAFVSVVAALVAGMVWARISGDIQRRVRVYNVISTVLIIVVVAIAAAVEYAGDVSNTIRYVIPLGAVGCGSIQHLHAHHRALENIARAHLGGDSLHNRSLSSWLRADRKRIRLY